MLRSISNIHAWLLGLAVIVALVVAAVVALDGAADASIDDPDGPLSGGPASSQSYDFGCANLTIGLELLDEVQHPFELTCFFQNGLHECESILAGAIQCFGPGNSFNWVCTEQGPESAYCARGGGAGESRNMNCTKTNDRIDCTGGTEPDFTDCESSGPPPNWDCTTPAGPFHCDADTNDFACLVEGLETATPAPTASPEPTATTGPSSLRWGDVDCNGTISVRDNQALLRFALSQPALSQTEPCPDLGTELD
jgi:hypothetical protein